MNWVCEVLGHWIEPHLSNRCRRCNTTIEANSMSEAWCKKCKASKGHYTHQHDDWIKICEEIERDGKDEN